MNLYSQGIKPSDNLVLRAALRLMPRDHRLIGVGLGGILYAELLPRKGEPVDPREYATG